MSYGVMAEHYQLTEESVGFLEGHGVKFQHLFSSVKLFDPHGTNSEINKIGLLYYVDEKGDFNEPPFFPHKRIAQAVYNQLPVVDKLMIAEYIDVMENGEYDEL